MSDTNIDLWGSAIRLVFWSAEHRRARALLMEVADLLGADALPKRYNAYHGLYAVYQGMRVGVELHQLHPEDLTRQNDWKFSVRVQARATPIWFRFERTHRRTRIRVGRHRTEDLGAIGAVLSPDLVAELRDMSIPFTLKRSGLSHELEVSQQLYKVHDTLVSHAYEMIQLYKRLADHLSQVPGTSLELDYSLLEYATDETLLANVYDALFSNAQQEERFPQVLRRERVLREAVQHKAPAAVLMRVLSPEHGVLSALIERAQWGEHRALEFLGAIGVGQVISDEAQAVKRKVMQLVGPEHLHERWATLYPGAMIHLLKAFVMKSGSTGVSLEVLKRMPVRHLIHWACLLHNDETPSPLYTPEILRLAQAKIQHRSQGGMSDARELFDELWAHVRVRPQLVTRLEWFELMMWLLPGVVSTNTTLFAQLVQGLLRARHVRGLRTFCDDPQNAHNRLLPKFLLMRNQAADWSKKVKTSEGRLSLASPWQEGDLTQVKRKEEE